MTGAPAALLWERGWRSPEAKFGKATAMSCGAWVFLIFIVLLFFAWSTGSIRGVGAPSTSVRTTPTVKAAHRARSGVPESPPPRTRLKEAGHAQDEVISVPRT